MIKVLTQFASSFDQPYVDRVVFDEPRMDDPIVVPHTTGPLSGTYRSQVSSMRLRAKEPKGARKPGGQGLELIMRKNDTVTVGLFHFRDKNVPQEALKGYAEKVIAEFETRYGEKVREMIGKNVFLEISKQKDRGEPVEDLTLAFKDFNEFVTNLALS